MKDDASPKRAPGASVLGRIGGWLPRPARVTGAPARTVIVRPWRLPPAGGAWWPAPSCWWPIAAIPRCHARALDGRRFDFTIDHQAYDASDVELLLNAREPRLGPYDVFDLDGPGLSRHRIDARSGIPRTSTTHGTSPAAGGDDHRQWRLRYLGSAAPKLRCSRFRASHGCAWRDPEASRLVGEADRLRPRPGAYRAGCWTAARCSAGWRTLGHKRFLDPHDVARVLHRIVQGETPRHAVRQQPRAARDPDAEGDARVRRRGRGRGAALRRARGTRSIARDRSCVLAVRGPFRGSPC